MCTLVPSPFLNFGTGNFELFREEIQLYLIRKLINIKIFQTSRYIMPENGSHLGYSLFPGVCCNSPKERHLITQAVLLLTG